MGFVALAVCTLEHLVALPSLTLMPWVSLQNLLIIVLFEFCCSVRAQRWIALKCDQGCAREVYTNLCHSPQSYFLSHKQDAQVADALLSSGPLCVLSRHAC
jgi:hypothetical protein